MFGTIKRFVVKRKKGMEALQAVLLLGAAFFVIMALKNLGTEAKGKASDQLESNFSATNASQQNSR